MRELNHCNKADAILLSESSDLDQCIYIIYK